MEKYREIIDLPHHVSKTRPQMPMSDRAAQFAPFAALTGYDAVVAETARLTTCRAELDEDEMAQFLCGDYPACPFYHPGESDYYLSSKQ